MKQNSQGQVLVPKKIIEHYSYHLHQMIGQGYSSQVFKGKDENTGEEVAVKVIDIKKVRNEVEKFLLNNEICVMKKLKNQNILKLNDVYQTQNNTYIITEFCNDGDLKGLLQKYKTFSEKDAVKIMRHLLHGFRELVRKQVVHRDLKPANILMKNGIPKLADFGFSKDLESPPCKFYYNVGTPIYMSPEALKSNQYSHKSDIWSLGVIYYELLYGETPFNAANEKQLGEIISRQAIAFPYSPQVSEQSKDFIRRCLSIDINQRLSSEQIELHPLIQNSIQQELQEQTRTQAQKVQQQSSQQSMPYLFQQIPPQLPSAQQPQQSQSQLQQEQSQQQQLQQQQAATLQVTDVTPIQQLLQQQPSLLQNYQQQSLPAFIQRNDSKQNQVQQQQQVQFLRSEQQTEQQQSQQSLLQQPLSQQQQQIFQFSSQQVQIKQNQPTTLTINDDLLQKSKKDISYKMPISNVENGNAVLPFQSEFTKITGDSKLDNHFLQSIAGTQPKQFNFTQSTQMSSQSEKFIPNINFSNLEKENQQQILKQNYNSKPFFQQTLDVLQNKSQNVNVKNDLPSKNNQLPTQPNNFANFSITSNLQQQLDPLQISNNLMKTYNSELSIHQTKDNLQPDYLLKNITISKGMPTSKLESSSEQLVKKYRSEYPAKQSTGITIEDFSSKDKEIDFYSNNGLHSASKSTQQEDFNNNDKVILAQINLCRYLLRLSKLTEEFAPSIKTNLKQKLIFLILKNVMLKIDKLNEMCVNYKNIFKLQSFQDYTCSCDNFKKFIIVINEYYQKYQKIFQQTKTQQLASEDKLYSTNNTFSELALYHQQFANQVESDIFYLNVKSILKQVILEINLSLQQNIGLEESDQLSTQIEGQVILLDYLITYFQIISLIIDSNQDYQYFAQTSKIEQIAEGRPTTVTKFHYYQIQNKLNAIHI